MNEDLRDILVKYKECTLKIIEVIENDNIESLQKLIDRRQNLLEEASNINNKKGQLKQIYEELNLDEIQSELNILMTKKLAYIKNEMNKIAKSKTANNMYNKGNNNGAKIFSKKI
ncbi:flagellar protein FliT [Clostridium sp. JN-9]|uniref:flagellar protein FliT n=1 Tax=Clostridium sp. JN-9 TaxID=2507159 RepID=UPI000FFE325F|nr:flagellar protein FliT [Clostridium sp. JN-9]QAT40543.1 flagellar protein FliT [Clostridium sp. JN-9]